MAEYTFFFNPMSPRKLPAGRCTRPAPMGREAYREAKAIDTKLIEEMQSHNA